MIEQTPKGEVAAPRTPTLIQIDSADLRRFVWLGRWMVEHLEELGTDLVWHGDAFVRSDISALVERYDAVSS